jgi:hypothetical protein
MVPVVHPSKDALILDHAGMLMFCVGMFVTMCAVGGIEHVPGYLLEQVMAAIVGMTLMLDRCVTHTG